jgi:hypothetical protein
LEKHHAALTNSLMAKASPLTKPSRRTDKLTPTQAQTVIAAAILRQLHVTITTGRAWDPDIATHGTGQRPDRSCLSLHDHRSPLDTSESAC